MKQLGIRTRMIYQCNHKDEKPKWGNFLEQVDKCYTFEYAIADRNGKVLQRLEFWLRGSLIPLLNNFLPLGSGGGIQFFRIGAARGTDQTFRDQPNTRSDAGIAPGGIRTWQRY